MTAVIADIVEPSQLIAPTKTPITGHERKGSLVISGAKLYFYNGTAFELVTSA